MYCCLLLALQNKDILLYFLFQCSLTDPAVLNEHLFVKQESFEKLEFPAGTNTGMTPSSPSKNDEKTG